MEYGDNGPSGLGPVLAKEPDLAMTYQPMVDPATGSAGAE
jgi:hypothetical protein